MPLPDKKKNTQLWQYAGMTAQFLVAIGAGLFIGLKADNWLKFKTPLLVWILPLFIIIGVIVKLIRDTGKRK
jgi:hypothetical protein